MDNNSTYEQEIDLKDLVFAILYKWRVVMLAAVLFAVILGGYKMVDGIAQQRGAEYMQKEQKQQKQYQKDVEEYETIKAGYEQEIKNIRRNIEAQSFYLENSILMNMDPYDKHTASVDFLFKQEVFPQGNASAPVMYVYNNGLTSAYTSYITQGIDLSGMAKELGTQTIYLKELITVIPDEWGQMLSLSVCYTDKKGAEQILDVILDAVKEKKDDFTDIFGAHELYITNRMSDALVNGMHPYSGQYYSMNGALVDTKLAENQKQMNDSLVSLQTTLKEKEGSLEALEEPLPPVQGSMMESVKTGIKYVVLGGVLGAFIAVFCICVAFLMTDKVSAAKELKRRYRLKVLAEFPREPKKRLCSGIDRWIDRLGGKTDSLSEDERYELAAANLKNYAGSAKNLMVIGTVSTETLTMVAEKLAELCSDMTLAIGADLNKNAEAVRKLSEYEAVILVEQSEVSHYREIEKEIETVYNVKKEIVGVMVF